MFEIAVEPLAAARPIFELGAVQWPDAWLADDPELPARLIGERERSVEVWRRTRIESPAAPRYRAHA